MAYPMAHSTRALAHTGISGVVVLGSRDRMPVDTGEMVPLVKLKAPMGSQTLAGKSPEMFG